ncbi:Holliday junction resolvase YqgF [Hydrogenobaculum sp. Y04AAS1]|jgi:putative Holliday junction resolvase|uniref:Holliday junction resolvase RuvX n=1 Tax=Hydrogenobaculum sp. (strain Y04AAS1) TaxID=380749 RepID=UPI00015BD217|nr:Holliday junction resolvase YqgF [Hydrogenobaculum sp. Y04AAS1]HCT67163.1 Holliday junction resolvase RuvX [Hydrogenobaculum sp.]
MILGIDYGTKRIGLALGDKHLKIYKPFKIIKNDKNLIQTLKHIVKAYKIELIVLGYPLTPSGKEGQRAKKVKKFYELLKKELNIDIVLQDERYTTFEAKSLSDEKEIDHISAYIILKEYAENL